MSQNLKIQLKSCGNDKLAVIKQVRELTGMGLKEAKDLVDKVPVDFDMTGDKETVINALRNAGATVSVYEITETGEILGYSGNHIVIPGDNNLTVHLESAGSSKLDVVKQVKELTGMGLKEAKELVDSAPVDFDMAGDKDTVIKALRDIGATVSVKEIKTLDPSIPNKGDATVIITEEAINEVNDAIKVRRDLKFLSLPSLSSKRTDAVKVLQEVIGLEQWEAEIFVDKSPIRLTLSEIDVCDLLISKLGSLGFNIAVTTPACFSDEGSAKYTEEQIKNNLTQAEQVIENIRGAYNKIITLVTVSQLVSNLIIKETSHNLETAGDNYQKIQSILAIAQTSQKEASRDLKTFVSIKEDALQLLADAQSNGAIEEASYTLLVEMVDKVVALYNDAKNLTNNLINSAVASIQGYVKTAYDALESARNVEQIGNNILEKYSGEAIYEGLTALSEINYALPLPHTARGTVYRRSKCDADTVRAPFVGVLVEISGIVSPDADKTEADEKPSCYTDSNGEFIIVMPERYSLKETLRIIVSQGANRQIFLKSATEFLYSVPEQKLLDKFVEVDNLGMELSNLKANLSVLEADYDALSSYKDKLDIRMSILVPQRDEQDNIELTKLDPVVQDYIISLNINLYEAKDEIEKEISALGIQIQKVEKAVDDLLRKIDDQDNYIKEYESRFKSLKTALLASLNEQKHLSFPETVDLNTVFDAFLAKTSAPEAKLEGTDLSDDYEGFVVIDEVFQGNYADAAKALPSVKLMENEGREIRLPSDTAPSRVFNYSMLQRLVEPKLTRKNQRGDRYEVSRITMSEPVDIRDFKEQIIKNPDEYPQMSTLGMGYVLNMHQAWVPDGFALGSLLYSLILAPGEEQRLIVRENKQSYILSDMAEGTDLVSEGYQMAQDDDTTAAYNYALDQLSTASSHYSYKTRTWGGGASGGLGAIGNGISGMLGLSGSYSKSSGSGSSSSRQSNSHNEASTAAQSFQHSIKSASDMISQAKRISLSTASSDVNESVATKIIANHNHSHAMTIQYWEVMRRYRLETCVEGVDLVLFVPLKLVQFLPTDQEESLDINDIKTKDNKPFGKTHFRNRYDVLLKYAQTLQYALPSKYRQGLKLIQHYSALPSWTLEESSSELKTLSFTIKASLLSCDKLTATLVLKNGKGSVTATLTVESGTPFDVSSLDEQCKKTSELLQALSDERKKYPSVKLSCTFALPDDIHEDDLSHISISYSCESTSIPLMFQILDPEIKMNGNVNGMKSANDYVALGFNQAQGKAIVKMAEAYWYFIQNNSHNQQDLQAYYHYRSGVPECLQSYPEMKFVALNSTTIRKIEPIRIAEATLGVGTASARLTTDRVLSSVLLPISTEVNTLRLADLRRIEETFMHVISETMHYSQVIWGDMSADERAMTLEKYTIDMDFSSINDSLSFGDNDGINQNGKITIPLLNCVNVKKVIGFYGNCILMPFTYPSSLARKLGKTAGEIQDALYRYHTSCFRAPTTTISLPTSGMVGEAVLGETNVSEKIDITRFWNWQDSPIDKMNLDQNYLNGKDYLSEKSTQGITALGLDGATAATPVTNADLISALVKKQTPTFNDITGLDQLKDVLNAGTTSAATGRDNYIKEASSMASKALDAVTGSAKKTNQQGADGQGDQSGKGGKGDQSGKGGQGDQGGQGGQGGAAGGPSASFTATLTFNTGNMNGKTTASSVSGRSDGNNPDDQPQPEGENPQGEAAGEDSPSSSPRSPRNQ